MVYELFLPQQEHILAEVLAHDLVSQLDNIAPEFEGNL